MESLLLDFPLRGEWSASRTPAAGVPTHGTDFLGQRYAYDFVRRTGRRWSPFGPNIYRHFWLGAPVAAFAAWGQPVYAAAAGTVVALHDGTPDTPRLHGWATLIRLRIVQRLKPVRITRADWSPLAGNYLAVAGEGGVAFYAHLRCGSVRPGIGDTVQNGDLLGEVGNSGRSSQPHLHFHVMDGATVDARGVACGFRGFEEWAGSTWQLRSGYPTLRARIRVTAAT